MSKIKYNYQNLMESSVKKDPNESKTKSTKPNQVDLRDLKDLPPKPSFMQRLKNGLKGY